MMMPKKVKFRKQQRGRMAGKAWRGSTISFGDFGLKAMECGWVTDRQIEAAGSSQAGHQDQVYRPGRRGVRDMKAQKVRDLDTSEIENQLKGMDEQRFRLQFQKNMGQTDGLKKLRTMRKDKARMLTILRE